MTDLDCFPRLPLAVMLKVVLAGLSTEDLNVNYV